MKRLITSFALTMLVMLGASGIATAQTTTNYTCMEGGNPPPPSNNGNIIIKEKGPCTLDGMNYQAGVSTIGGYLQITAGGAITITTTIPGAGLAAFGPGGYVSIQGGAKTMLTGDINAQSYIYMTSKGDIDVTGTLNAVAGNILVIGQKKVATGAITGAANGGYNIDLKAEQGDSSPAAFVIDKSSSNATNGVNGTITANAGSGGAVIYITNGGAGSSGDINLKDATGLIVSGTTATGDIILNAQNGTLMMPGGANGTLSADGTGTAPAGQIQLLAQTVTFADKGIVSASQATTTAGALHGVAISAASITFGGNKLEIHADGNGGGANGAFAYLLPEGATTITDDTSNPINIPITISNTQIQGAMSITGTGNLTVTANGDQALVGVYAYPITISGAVVELQSTGTMALQHGVYVQNPGSLSGMVGLTMSGAVTLDGSAKGGGANGGLVIVSVDQTQLSGVTTLTATANGPSGARQNGPAGNVVWTSTNTLTLAGTSTFSANGAGTGAGGALTFTAGSFAFNGTQVFSAISLGSAMGGNIYLASTASGQTSTLALGTNTTINVSSVSGDAGSVTVTAASQPIDITGDGITLTAGDNGNGATISVTASQITLSGELDADGQGSGSGGNISLNATGDTPIDLTEGQLIVAEGGDDNGNGGQVSISNAAAFDVDAVIDVDGGDGTDGCCGMSAVAATKAAIAKPQDTAVSDGLKTVNGVSCQQYQTANADNGATWPKTYWNCVSIPPTMPTALDMATYQAAYQNLSSNLRTLNGTDTIRIYVFATQAAHNTFFKLGAVTQPESGETHIGTETPANIYSAVWETNTMLASAPTLSETTLHEVGHAFDYFFGPLSGAGTYVSGNDNYLLYTRNDFLNLDYAYVDPNSVNTMNPGASVPRLPCASTPNPNGGFYPGLAPFILVVDSNGNSVCNGTVLSPTYSGFTSNSSILQSANVGAYWFTLKTNGWTDLFAQALAYQAYAKNDPAQNPPVLFGYPVPDNVFANGMFGCATSWATNIQAGSSTAPSIAACSAAIPDWYVF